MRWQGVKSNEMRFHWVATASRREQDYVGSGGDRRPGAGGRQSIPKVSFAHTAHRVPDTVKPRVINDLFFNNDIVETLPTILYRLAPLQIN